MTAKYVCYCKANPTPHFANAGNCPAPAHFEDTLCADCGQICEIVTEDFGIGPYECHGATGFHSDIREVSSCCGADTQSNLLPLGDDEEVLLNEDGTINHDFD